MKSRNSFSVTSVWTFNLADLSKGLNCLMNSSLTTRISLPLATEVNTRPKGLAETAVDSKSDIKQTEKILIKKTKFVALSFEQTE